MNKGFTAEGNMGAHGDNSFLHCVRLKSTIERNSICNNYRTNHIIQEPESLDGFPGICETLKLCSKT
jgi:hypothetical protein